MRLSQAKREFNVEITKIVHFLKTKGMVVTDHPNAKLTDDQVKLVREAFPTVSIPEANTPAPEEKVPAKKAAPKKTAAVKKAKELVEETPAPVAEVTSPIATPEPAIGEVIEVVKPKTKVKPKVEEDGKRKFTALEEDDAIEAEVIRAPKIELEGIKVLGKVELPKPKVKEAPAITEDEVTTGETKTETASTPPAPAVPDELAHLHPSKRAKVKVQEVVKTIQTTSKQEVRVKEKKKEKSIAEKVAEEKAQSQKKKKRKNPHRHVRGTGEQAQRIEILDDGTIVPRKAPGATSKGGTKESLWKRFWRWFNS